MSDHELAKRIEEQAMACGYDRCGIIPLDESGEFHRRIRARMKSRPTSAPFYLALEEMFQTKKRFPWAKSIVICIFELGRYRFPEELRGKYTKTYLLNPECYKDSQAHKDREAFERWMRAQRITFAGGMDYWHFSIGPLRHYAQLAGLGIIRKNNFFYTENGSFLDIVGYVIDRECELIQENNVKPCPEKCRLCQKACPTGTLSGPYDMNPMKCVAFINSFGQGILPPGVKKAQMKTWVTGCESCQDACPFNRKHDWSRGEEIPSLTALVEQLQPENIVMASDEFLKKEIVPLTYDHITEHQIGTIRRCAKIALENSKKE